MKRSYGLLLALLLLYAVLIGPFAAQMRQRPLLEKLGYVPEPAVLRTAAADQKQLVGAWLIFRTMMYYGGLPQDAKAQAAIGPDFQGIEQTLVAATRLDPYNMDAYYFGQATLVWDMQHIAEANALLDYGMHYRDWDFYLPFFAGFNASFFLKDYASAARYYRRAGEVTGNDTFMRLSERFLYEADQTEQAIAYLTIMVRGARNEAVRASLTTRLEFYQGIRMIELARDRFQQATGTLPKDLDALRQGGFLETLPRDPFGGTFILAPDGQVRSTRMPVPPSVKKEIKQ